MSAEDLKDWDGKAKPGMPLFEGPTDVRNAFIEIMGIDWTASYIDPAIWIDATRSLITKTHVAFDRISRQAPKTINGLQIKLRDGGKSYGNAG